MFKMNWFCVNIILALLASTNSLGFHGLHFKGLEEPEWIGARSTNEKWIEQPIDHFNHRDNRTWQMRYYEEENYFNESGPIFIMLGGEWDISPGYLQTGLMHDLGKQHGAMMFYTEHRYYGESRPTQNMSSGNLQHLSVDQALADVAYFINTMKFEKNISDSKVIVFGGSYAGNMATWMRIKYPHLVQGAVASSAPIYAKADFYEYYEVVSNSLKRYHHDCLESVKTAFHQVEELLLASENGPEKMKEIFKLCKAPNVRSTNDIGYFMNYLSEVFAGKVQYNKVSNKTSSIGEICDKMMNVSIGEAYERLALITVINNSTCKNLSYDSFVEEMSNVTWSSSANMRQWYFQTCTEFGYYQTSNSDKSAFGTQFGLEFFVNVCSDVYGHYYEKALMHYGVNRTNIVYGGHYPDVTNVIFVNGDVDPWHALSVLTDLNESSPAIFIEGASHCQDLKADTIDDPPELTKARKSIKKIVSSWIDK